MHAAAGLETAVARGETALGPRLEALEAGIGALIAASAPWRGAGWDPPPPAAAGAAPDPQCLAALREALRGRDLGAIDAFESLRPRLREVLGEAGCEGLRRAIHDLNFSAALALFDDAMAGCPGAAGAAPADAQGAPSTWT